MAVEQYTAGPRYNSMTRFVSNWPAVPFGFWMLLTSRLTHHFLLSADCLFPNSSTHAAMFSVGTSSCMLWAGAIT